MKTPRKKVAGIALLIVVLTIGITSPLRCLLGGIAMGVAEALAAGYTSGMVTAMVPFLFVLIVLSLSNIGGGAMAGDRP